MANIVNPLLYISLLLLLKNIPIAIANSNNNNLSNGNSNNIFTVPLLVVNFLLKTRIWLHPCPVILRKKQNLKEFYSQTQMTSTSG